MAVAKVSISLDREQLRRARDASKAEGISLSSYLARALANQLDEQERIDAARALHREWGETIAPTARERADFLELMTRTRKRRRRAA